MELRVGIVTGRETVVNRETGGPSVRLLQVQITDHNDVQTVQLVGQAGEEVNPPNGTLVLVLPGGQAFKLSAGTSDWVVPIMDIGGKRLYALDPTTGEVSCDIRLNPDSSVTVANSLASFTMTAAGVFNFSGVSANFDCPLTAPTVTGTTDVVFAGKSAVTHIHSGVLAGGANTGVTV